MTAATARLVRFGGTTPPPADPGKPQPVNSADPPLSTMADEPTRTISPGGTATGVVDDGNDVDLFTISLVAGQTYLISLVGSGPTPLQDTYLSLISAGTVVAVDDDGGQGTNSLLTFTATTTGTYQISVEGYPDNDPTGGYTLDVRQMSADSVGSTIPTANPIAIGRTFGFIETSNDADMYAVTLTAGQYYAFNLDGGIDYASDGGDPGELDTVITIYNSAGEVVGTNDNASDDLNSAFGFIAPASGTYYVQVSAASGQTGGYSLNLEQFNLASLDPLDTLDTGMFFESTAITVYFAPAGETYDGVTSLGWEQFEIDAAMAALQTYADISDLTFSITNNPAGATFRLVTTQTDEYLGYFNFPNTLNSGVGVFSRTGQGWNSTGGLEPGGYGFVTLVHEFGHGLGLAHPHDEVGTATIMPGVTGPFGSYGVFDLNQGVYTTMSYNDGWQLHPSGQNTNLNYGYQAGPSALDIAVIQQYYGASTANTGNTVYTLPTANAAGTFWDVIWDTGGTDSIVHSGTVSATINLTAATLDYSATGGGAISYVNGIYGGFTIAAGVVIENATGGSGADILTGNSAANQLSGGGGNDTITGLAGADILTGGGGADSLTGGIGNDTFRDTSAGLSGDIITDFAFGDRIVISDATLSGFTYSLSGSTLTYTGGTLTLPGATGALAVIAAPEGGVQLTLHPRAALTLTETGQDFMIGGDVLVYGTTGAGEVIEVLHGDVLLDASFNLGGDTVVLPGNAGSYTAVLSGSFVTIAGGDLVVAIPVGTAGLNVQFADSTRVLRFDTGAGQVMLGTQAITSTTTTVSASGPALSDPIEIGPDSLGRLVLAEDGQDVDIGGNVSIFGTTAPGEVITVIHGTVVLDASFNVGGDTIALPGNASSYTATLSGSFVTIAGGDISVAIPVGTAGITIDFADADRMLRFDTASGQVMLGSQAVTSGGTALAGAPLSVKDSADPVELAYLDSHRMDLDSYRLDIDSFSFG